MTIATRSGGEVVECGQCGKRGRVSAGARRVRCTGCGETLSVERAQAPAVARPAAREPGRDALDHERHVRAIAVWYRIIGLLLMIATLLTAAPAILGGGRLMLALVVPAVLVGGLGAAHVALGQGLFTYRPWARAVALALLALGSLATLASLAQGEVLRGLIGLAWSGAVAWALACPAGTTIFTPDYARAVERTPDARVAWWTSPFFYVPAALLGLALLLAFGSAGALLR
ncbi:MAG: hypothetical protein M9894_28725 [Planctomycetes bacterium]|nr:hypothetical protein [Planctomycetota bacterium]